MGDSIILMGNSYSFIKSNLICKNYNLATIEMYKKSNEEAIIKIKDMEDKIEKLNNDLKCSNLEMDNMVSSKLNVEEKASEQENLLNVIANDSKILNNKYEKL